MAELAGTTIGPYRLDSFLGRGGMADVYLALHKTSGRQVALKLVRIAENSNSERRFLSEAQLMSNLDHPDIVRLYDFFESGGMLALAIEYVPGQSLDEVLENRYLSPAESLSIFRKVLPALSYLHERGIVHRDIKPSNIRLMPNGDIKLLDFGIARTTGSNRLTQVGRVVGTAFYLSPEIRAGEEPRAAADVWALGILLKELNGSSLKTQRPRLRSREERIIQKIQDRCLQRKPEDRFRNAHEIERELDVESLTGSGFDLPAFDKRIIAIVGSICIAILVLLWVAISGGGGSRPVVATASTGGGTVSPVPGINTIPVTIATFGDSADIYIDGKFCGTAKDNPAAVQVSPGMHQLELRQNGKTVYGPETTTFTTANNYFNIPLD